MASAGMSSYGIPAENFGSIATSATYSGDIGVFEHDYTNNVHVRGVETQYLMRADFITQNARVSWGPIFGDLVPVPGNADGIVLWLAPFGHVGKTLSIRYGEEDPVFFFPTVPGAVMAPFPSTINKPFGMEFQFTSAEEAGMGVTILGFHTTPVPEPKRWMLLLCGIGAIALVKRRRAFA